MVNLINKFGKLEISLAIFNLGEDYTLNELNHAYKNIRKKDNINIINDAYVFLLNYDFIRNLNVNDNNLPTPDQIDINTMTRIRNKIGDDINEIKKINISLNQQLRNFDSDPMDYFIICNEYSATKRYLNDCSFRELLIPVDLKEAINCFSSDLKNKYYDSIGDTKKYDL